MTFKSNQKLLFVLDGDLLRAFIDTKSVKSRDRKKVFCLTMSKSFVFSTVSAKTNLKSWPCNLSVTEDKKAEKFFESQIELNLYKKNLR